MNTTLRLGLLLATSLLLVGCAAATASPTPAPAATLSGLAPQVTVMEAAALRDGGALMLDVREPAEWTAGHIPGATLIPLGELPGRLAELPRDRMIVTVCRSGNRSAEARDILLSAGYEAVASMTGGMNQWIAEGFPVVTGP